MTKSEILENVDSSVIDAIRESVANDDFIVSKLEYIILFCEEFIEEVNNGE